MFTTDDLLNFISYLSELRNFVDPNDVNNKTVDSRTQIRLRDELIKSTEFYNKILDQPYFWSTDYNKLKNFIIDWYTAHKTVTSIQKNVFDVHSLPESVVDELLKSFGYKNALKITPLSSKVYFYYDLVGFYKKKGTPETLIKVFDYYGYSGADLIEYWLVKDINNKLVFEPRVSRKSTQHSGLSLSRTPIPFQTMVQDDPHWLQTEGQILQLCKTNKISLPSKTPYFSLTSLYSLENLNSILSIISTLVQGEFSNWYNQGNYSEGVQLKDMSTYPIAFNDFDSCTSILGLYFAITYLETKLFGNVGSDSDLRYIHYNGSVSFLEKTGTTNLTSNVSQSMREKFSKVLDYYNSLVDESRYSTIWSRQIKEDSYYKYNTTFTKSIHNPYIVYDKSNTGGVFNTTDIVEWDRNVEKSFVLYKNIEELFSLYDPKLKTEIDGYFLAGDGYTALLNLYNGLDVWIQTNLSTNTPSLAVSCLGFGFKGQIEEVVEFFKPYRSRLAFLDIGYLIDNRLSESIRFGTESRVNTDLITGVPVTDSTPSQSNKVGDILQSTIYELELSAQFEVNRSMLDSSNNTSFENILNRHINTEPKGLDVTQYPGNGYDQFIVARSELNSNLAFTCKNYFGPGWIYENGQPIEYTDGSFGQVDEHGWRFDSPWSNDTCIIICSDGKMYHDCLNVNGIPVPDYLKNLIPSN